MPSRVQLETALRNADAAGDTEAATQLATALKSGQYDEQKDPSSVLSNPLASPITSAIGTGEALAQIGSGMASSVAGGLAGLGTLATGGSSEDAAKTIQNIQESGTYQPRTAVGQQIFGNIANVMGSDYNPLNIGKVINRELGGSDALAAAGFPAAAVGLDVGSDLIAGLGVSKLAGVGVDAAKSAMASRAQPVLAQEAPITSAAMDRVTPIKNENLTIAPEVAKTQDVASAFADSGMKNRIGEITSNITLNPERVAAADRLGLKPPIATLSDDRSLQEVAGALAASPGSKAAAELGEYHKALTDKSKQLIEEAGGDLDKGLVSNELKDKIDANIKLLGSQSKDIYSQIEQAVPHETIINAKPLLNELKSRGSKSQRGVGGLSSVEQDVYKTLQGKPTYFDVDNLRKDIGESIGGIKGSYPTASSSTLKDMYSKLTQLQEGAATQVGNGAGNLWRDAKELDKSRFALQDNAQFLFGKDLNGAVIPKVEQGLKQLAKGDSKVFNAVIDNVPKEMKGRILMTGIDGMLTKTAQGEASISPVQFNKWYGDLSRSETNKKLLHSNLPEGAGQRLDDIFKLSQGLQNVTTKITRTGIVPEVFKNFDKNGGLIDKLYSTADKIDKIPIVGAAVGAPAVRIASSLLKMGAKEKTPAVQAADDLLHDPQFRTAILDYAKNGKADTAAQTTLKKNDSYKRFMKKIGTEESTKKLLIDRGGLVPFLLLEEDKNDAKIH